ncbi:hypothetical protein Aph01nite_19620 [Acrocarpospora phusangensis]|uniref:Uncharacterized protein n=1 Tax=Acrocarpospora phusangensis TaxID=1070424 RepID=A0A919QC83_9ACTN|nr:DUF6247 family protein [Acrocarpospora phusangensis]GIH23652.1 hypothetical protein Aph01nite_19620 [Acrocarpospora phusangensis]
MSTPHHQGQALIPRPPLTTAALRAAVAQIAPAHLMQFVEHLDQATEQAARQSTVAPLHGFLAQWGEFVAIHRYPAKAARLRDLEQQVATATDRQAVTAAIAEIRQITDAARRDTVGE